MRQEGSFTHSAAAIRMGISPSVSSLRSEKRPLLRLRQMLTESDRICRNPQTGQPIGNPNDNKNHFDIGSHNPFSSAQTCASW